MYFNENASLVTQRGILVELAECLGLGQRVGKTKDGFFFGFVHGGFAEDHHGDGLFANLKVVLGSIFFDVLPGTL